MKKVSKLISGALTLTTVSWLLGASFFVPVAAGQTTADLQAQIAALLAQISALQAQLNAQAGGSTTSFTFTRDLTVGSTGNDVKQLQMFLNSKGFTVAVSGAGSVGNESMYFGGLTKAALAKFQAANGISPAVGYFGPITRAKIAGMVVVTPPGPGTPPPAGAMVISLASDNPASGSLPKGAAGVTFLKFDITGSGTIDTLTFKRVGIGATADFGSAGIYLYDGSTRLTSGKTLNSTTHEVSFPALNLSVSGKKTLSLVADVASGATTGNVNAFNLVSAVAASGSSVSGTIAGNPMTIGGQTVGGLDPTSGAAPTNPKVGQVAAKLAEFTLTASSTEDVKIYRLSLTEGGSITNSNLTNFVLKQAGNTVATAASIGAKDLVTFNFNTPFLVEKGQQKTFELYGDVGPSSRTNDTIVFYFDSKADIYAVGVTYGYPVLPTIDALDTTSEGDTLTVQGGQLTITFNGPISGDIALRGQDVKVFDFTIASQNNVEIKYMRFHATTTGIGANEGFNDMKVWDADTNSVITSAVDITAADTDVTYNDTINIGAGKSRHFKVTVDVDADDDNSDTYKVGLLAFQSGDVKNLDNNTNLTPSSDIVPNSAIVGNVQTVKAPALDVQLSATPSSQTYVQGTNDVALAGFSFRATGDSVRLDSVRVTATSSTGTLGSGEIQNLALYDGSTRLSDFKSLDSTALTATFNNLNLTIPSGSTKVLTVRGNISATADNSDVYYFYLASAGANDITAYDSQGNAASLTGVAANNGGTVSITIATVGNATVVAAPSDSETEAGIILAGTESVLGKYRVTAANEAMTINKLNILVASSSSATATSSTPSADEVPTIKLYDGSTQIGNSGGYTVLASGASSGIAIVEGLNWVIPKDTTKVLTVKGVVNSIAAGADTGASVWAHIQATGFEAQGATSKDTSITAASGYEKQVFKTKPVISLSSTQPTTLGNGEKDVIRFKIKADGPEQIAWKKLSFQVALTGTTLSAVTAAPGTTGNIKIREVGGSYLSIATAFSGEGVASTSQAAVTGGTTAYVGIIMTSEQAIAAGAEKEYILSLTFANTTATAGAASVDTRLYRQETSSVASDDFDTIEGAQDTATPSFIWSDYSATGHAESTNDWSNGVFVKTLPSSGVVIGN